MSVTKFGLSDSEVNNLLNRKLDKEPLYLEKDNEIYEIINIGSIMSDLFIVVKDNFSGKRAIIGHPYASYLYTKEDKSILKI